MIRHLLSDTHRKVIRCAEHILDRTTTDPLFFNIHIAMSVELSLTDDAGLRMLYLRGASAVEIFGDETDDSIVDFVASRHTTPFTLSVIDVTTDGWMLIRLQPIVTGKIPVKVITVSHNALIQTESLKLVTILAKRCTLSLTSLSFRRAGPREPNPTTPIRAGVLAQHLHEFGSDLIFLNIACPPDESDFLDLAIKGCPKLEKLVLCEYRAYLDTSVASRKSCPIFLRP